MLIPRPTAPVFSEEFLMLEDTEHWSFCSTERNYPRWLSGLLVVFFHSQEAVSIGKDIAWEIFTYALFPELRLSVEHSLTKTLV